MISGLGFFEILVILLIILMFFGSKELPHFIREGARMVGKLRRYSEKVRRELNDVTQIADVSDTIDPDDDVNKRKDKVRHDCLTKRKLFSDEEHKEKSARIAENLFGTEEYKKARTVLLYAATKTEVQTLDCIQGILDNGKRVILPYCYPKSTEMGIAEITSIAEDLIPGEFNVMEPRDELKDNFLKSDIDLVVCPGVAFDKQCGRLGRGKGCYDYFLKELKEKAPLVGFSYQCQIIDDDLPFDYHDIPMDIVITEEAITRQPTG